MADIRDGSATGLLLFLDQRMLDKSIDMATGRAYRSAVRRILGPSGRTLDEVNVRELDLDDAWRRFRASESATSVSPASLPSYRTRLRKSVAMYRNWLEDGVEPKAPDAGDRLVDYPFPVREGVRATLRLPERITEDEAARLAAFVSALALHTDSLDADA